MRRGNRMKKFINDMQDKGFQTVVSERNDVMQLVLIREGQKSMFFKIENGWFTTIVVENQNRKYMTKIEIEKVINYFRQTIKQPILFHVQNIMGEKDEIKEWFQEKEYEPFDDYKTLNKYAEERVKENGWITKEDHQKMKEVFSVFESFRNKLKKISNEIALFDYWITDKKYQFNNNGFEGYFALQKVDDSFLLQINNEHEKLLKEWTLSTKEEIETTIEQWIQQNHQQQRIRNIVNPSKTRFNRFISLINWDMLRESMYESFLLHFNPEEIETIAALYPKGSLTYKKIDSHHHFFYYKDSVILMSKVSEKVYKIANNEQTNEQIIHLLKEERGNRVNEILKQL
jgi:hypothetical protein